jgi:hypothetical protein
MGKASAAKKLAVIPKPIAAVKLDFGCGPNKRAGFEGVDARQFVGVDHVVDLTKTPWKWPDNSVEEAHASHFVEHLTAVQRVAFCNELYRILQPGATCQIIVPHWASCRAYGDPTHQWPPVSEFWFYYLSKDWRAQNAPHTDLAWNPQGFSCDFEATWAYSLRADLMVRSEEYRQDAMQNHKEVLLDTLATLKAKK